MQQDTWLVLQALIRPMSKKVTTAVTLVQTVEATVMILVMTMSKKMILALLKEEDADDHESTGTETPFVPGLIIG